MKKIISVLLVTVLSAFALTACSGNTDNYEGTSGSSGTTYGTTGTTVSAGTTASAGQTDTTSNQTFTKTNTIEINVKNYGTITVALDAKHAPITVANFLQLAKSKFYDGLTFHRIISGFMIQGGDPNGDGTGGSGKTIKGEFSDNGVNNPLSLTRGVIALARLSNDMDSATSQFFIVQEDFSSYDGQYAGFGYVTSGMDIVDKICKDTPVQDSNGTVLAKDQPVINTVKVIE